MVFPLFHAINPGSDGRGSMNVFMFVYSVCIMMVFFAAAIFSLAAYLVSERKSFLPHVTLFVFYIIELAGIFGNEWLAQNVAFSAENYYEISSPVLRVITGTGIIASLWVMMLRMLDIHNQKAAIALPAAFAVACVLVLTLMPHGQVRQFVFYSLRQLFAAFILIFAFMKWAASKDAAYRERLGKYHTSFVVLCLLVLLVFAEDTWVILIAPMPDPTQSSLTLYLSERNFSENFLMAYIAFYCIKKAVSLLKLRFSQPQAEVNQEGDLARHIADALPAYAKNNGLSARESEVLALVLAGKDNRSIATELFLSEGTIKSHVHNIMKKTGTSSRDELKRSFWSA